jgi:SET domain
MRQHIGHSCGWSPVQQQDQVLWCMLQGNKARFINHSCDPNCYSDIKQVSTQGHGAGDRVCAAAT